MKIYSTILFYLTLTLSSILLNSCRESDDVAGIFLNKQWKLTNIYMDDNSFPPDLARDYWINDADRKKSYRELDKIENFVIQFEGFEEKNKIRGALGGRVTTANISGTWSVDGETNVFSTTLQSVDDADPLGRAFINALNNAYKYTGDYNTLQIYFKEGQTKKYLLFRVNKDQ